MNMKLIRLLLKIILIRLLLKIILYLELLEAKIFGIEFRCAICNIKFPRLFKVKDDEWRKTVPKDLQKKIICLPCYQKLASSKSIQIDMKEFK